MKLIDLNDDRVYTPADLKRDWAQFACGHSFEIKEGIRMYIHELLNNPEFNFNAPVRILKYLGGDETVTVFDSTVSGDIHFDLMMKSITAINPGDDGVLEIEYAD